MNVIHNPFTSLHFTSRHSHTWVSFQYCVIYIWIERDRCNRERGREKEREREVPQQMASVLIGAWCVIPSPHDAHTYVRTQCSKKRVQVCAIYVCVSLSCLSLSLIFDCILLSSFIWCFDHPFPVWFTHSHPYTSHILIIHQTCGDRRCESKTSSQPLHRKRRVFILLLCLPVCLYNECLSVYVYVYMYLVVGVLFHLLYTSYSHTSRHRTTPPHSSSHPFSSLEEEGLVCRASLVEWWLSCRCVLSGIVSNATS